MVGQLKLARGAFLRQDWQRRPRLMQQALPGFHAPLDGAELAGLALEPDVESRLIAGNDDVGYTLRHGPFTEADFLATPERDWTLLVQDVEKHLPELVWIIDAFDFLPGWRVDDLMVSYAAPGGSVGPHVDAYDVFLLQGSGRRRWLIDERSGVERRERSMDGLRLIDGFEPTAEWVLDPGDVLYLPPGVPHHGIALDACTTWSIGLRAPALDDILAEIVHGFQTTDTGQIHLRDAGRAIAGHPLVLDAQTRKWARQQLRALLRDDALIDRALACALSRQKPDFLDMESSPDNDLPGPGQTAGRLLVRNPATRCVVLPGETGLPGSLYINGEEHLIAPHLNGLVETLTATRAVPLASLKPWLADPSAAALLHQLMDDGYWTLT